MRKRRTREHIIADLSVNHVERFILRAGHTAERVYRDYGYDLITFTFILILFDAQNESAYWIHVQAATSPALPTANEQTLTVRFPAQQLVSEAAVAEWRQIKNNRV